MNSAVDGVSVHIDVTMLPEVAVAAYRTTRSLLISDNVAKIQKLE
jgi:predicted MarR family transcription regulator